MIEEFGSSPANDQAKLNAALLLEMSAEATRDPQIASAVQVFDRELRVLLVEWLTCSASQNRAHGDAPARALMLQIIFEGLRVRETCEPGLDRN